MEQEDIIQECKNQNKKLVDYLTKAEIIAQLLDLILKVVYYPVEGRPYISKILIISSTTSKSRNSCKYLQFKLIVGFPKFSHLILKSFFNQVKLINFKYLCNLSQFIVQWVARRTTLKYIKKQVGWLMWPPNPKKYSTQNGQGKHVVS